MVIKIAISIVFFCHLLVANAALATTPIGHIVVLPIFAAKGLDKESAKLLNEVFLTEMSRVVPKSIRLIGSADIEAMLGHEQQRQLVDCDDTSCLAEIGNALGASHLLVPSIGKFGEQYIINLKLVDVTSAQVLYRQALYVGANEKAILRGLQQIGRDMAIELHWTVETVAAPTAPVVDSSPTTAPPRDKADPANDNPDHTWLWTGAAVGGAGLVAALGFSVGALVLDDQVNKAISLEDKGNAAAVGLGLLGGAGLGGLAVITGAVWVLVTVLDAE